VLDPAHRTDSLVAAAVDLAPRMRTLADEAERGRRLPAQLVRAFADAGFFHLCVPREIGGHEAHPATLVRVIEMLAAADGSAAWCAMIGATSGVASAYLAPDAAREIYGTPGSITGGAYAPLGRAIVVDGGYRVTGRWPFASGCEHCTWLMGGSVVIEQGTPRLLPGGLPDSRLMLFPAGDARIIDTWTVSGLRGTGSHDIAVDDLFVPAARSFSLVTDRPVPTGALYAFPVFGLLALGIAAVTLGIGRAAIDELVRLAGVKTPSGSRRHLAERAVIQAAVAEAEAALGAARALIFDAVAAAWVAAETAGTIDVRLRARLRLAATHAAMAAARAVDLMYSAAGGTAVYATSPLQRHFRDVHTATQHVMIAPATLELVGRVLLGLDADTTLL
jgi:alkylation response protein AidB-like acyl-CoA dehydrogenase